MNYEKFVQEMKCCIEMKLLNQEKIERQEILKNNGKKYIGLSIRKPEEDVVPIIYLEEFYERFLNGELLENLSEEIILIRNSSAVPSRSSYEWIFDFQKIQGRIIYRLVNFEKNKELLKEIPHLPMMDLAIIFSVVLPGNQTDYYSLLIRNEHINLWKVPISLLYETARKNTPRICRKIFRPLANHLSMLGEWEDFWSPLWILTNEQGIYGAAALLYPGMLQKIHQQLNCNYYLLPSSIHEFLVVPELYCDSYEELQKIVYGANATVIEQNEFLSDSVYYFNGKNITKV